MIAGNAPRLAYRNHVKKAYEVALCDKSGKASATRTPVYQTFMQPELEGPGCQTRLSDGVGSQYVGCSECYKVFRGQVLNNIQEMHGTRKHLGKRLREGRKTRSVDLSDDENMKEQYHLAAEEGRNEDAEELYGFIKRGEDDDEQR